MTGSREPRKKARFMSKSDNANYEGVLNIVRQWTPLQQTALVEDVLTARTVRLEPARPARDTLNRALGLLEADQPAPSDEEVEQWLDEHRMEKYWTPSSHATKTDFKDLQSQFSRPLNC